jgi:uncharacterized protein Veg
LASLTVPYFHQIFTGAYQLRPEFKQLFSRFIKYNCTVHYYLVPDIIPQTDDSNSKNAVELKANKAREDEIRESHNFLKYYKVEFIFKVEQPDGSVSYVFQKKDGSTVDRMLFSNSPINFFHNVLLKQIIKRLPFTNFSHSLMNGLIRDPFVASAPVIAGTANNAQTPVSHPNGLQGNDFGLMPDIQSVNGKLPEGPIFLPRGDISFGLEGMVRRFGHHVKKMNTTCIHNEVIKHLAELVSPGSEIYLTKCTKIFKIIHPVLGTAYISYQHHETSPSYSVIKISMRKSTKRRPIGQLKAPVW